LAVTTDGRTRTGNIEQSCKSGCENISAEWIAENSRGVVLADFVAGC
jgi:hypothetical protein